MPLCVLIYGGCQYQQNVIYCIKMRILLLLRLSPVRVTRGREPGTFSLEHLNKLLTNQSVSQQIKEKRVEVKAMDDVCWGQWHYCH